MKTATRYALVAIAVALIGTAGIARHATAHDDRAAWHQGDHHEGWGKRHGRGDHRHHGRRGHRGERFDRMLERFDSNGDGSLTQAELDGSRRALLEKFDTDGNGVLALGEFERLWLEMANERVVRRFQRLDRDGDASVTAAEFLDPTANVVERMDRNGDGALSREDRRRWKRRGHREGMGEEESAPAAQ